MRIIGVDPGLANTGWGIIDHDGRRSVLVASGCIVTASGVDLAQRLRRIHDDLSQVIDQHHPDVAAMEMLFFCTNVQTAVAVAQGRGVAILATAEARLPFHEYSPLQIKQAITGSGKADKVQIQRMVGVLLGYGTLGKPKRRNTQAAESTGSAGDEGATVPTSHHAADALAVALCHAHSQRFKSAAATALQTLAAKLPRRSSPLTRRR